MDQFLYCHLIFLALLFHNNLLTYFLTFILIKNFFLPHKYLHVSSPQTARTISLSLSLAVLASTFLKRRNQEQWNYEQCTRVTTLCLSSVVAVQKNLHKSYKIIDRGKYEWKRQSVFVCAKQFLFYSILLDGLYGNFLIIIIIIFSLNKSSRATNMVFTNAYII